MDDFKFSIDRDADVPVGVQLGWALCAHIRDGRFEPGQQLPTLRELAQATGLNVNTVRAVYQRLEQKGLIDSRQGSGTFVAGAQDGSSPVARIAARTTQEAGRRASTHARSRLLCTSRPRARAERSTQRRCSDACCTSRSPCSSEQSANSKPRIRASCPTRAPPAGGSARPCSATMSWSACARRSFGASPWRRARSTRTSKRRRATAQTRRTRYPPATRHPRASPHPLASVRRDRTARRRSGHRRPPPRRPAPAGTWTERASARRATLGADMPTAGCAGLRFGEHMGDGRVGHAVAAWRAAADRACEDPWSGPDRRRPPAGRPSCPDAPLRVAA